jgi:lipoyl(octanoyl) transferase
VPCGIADKAVGSLAQFCPGVTVEAVRPVVVTSFAQVFGVRPVIQNAAPPGL